MQWNQSAKPEMQDSNQKHVGTCNVIFEMTSIYNHNTKSNYKYIFSLNMSISFDLCFLNVDGHKWCYIETILWAKALNRTIC